MKWDVSAATAEDKPFTLPKFNIAPKKLPSQ